MFQSAGRAGSSRASNREVCPPQQIGASVGELYQAECHHFANTAVDPALSLPASYALNSSVQDWDQDRDGSWHLEDVWLGSSRP